MDWIDSVLGTVFYSMVVFTAGALLGKPLWCYMCQKFPAVFSAGCCKK